MNALFTRDCYSKKQAKSGKAPNKHQELKKSLIKWIDELDRIEEEMIPPTKDSMTYYANTEEKVIREDRINCTLLSRNEYNMLFDFFKVTKAWMYITDRNPKEYTDHNDIIYIIYRFLKDTISQRTTPRFETDLIKNTREETINKSDQDIVRISTKSWDSVKTAMSNKNEKEAKAAFVKSLTVTLGSEMIKMLKVVDDFKSQYYIGSKEVEHMTDKAALIVQELFKYYFNCPEMLPDEYLEEYCYLVDEKFNYYGELVATYLLDEYNKNPMRTVYIDKGGYWLEDMERLAVETKVIINNRHASNSNDENSTDDIDVYATCPPFLVMKELNEIAGGLSKLDDKMESQVTPILEGRQKNVFDNVWAKQNKYINPFKTGNHISKTILARIIADYISSMTDRMAILKYNEVTTSSTSWTEKYNG